MASAMTPPLSNAAALPRAEVTVVLPGQTPEGGYVLSVLLKRTYDIAPGGICTRAGKDRALIPGDVFWDDPMNSSVRFESDFIPWKLATDVVLNGRAYAPDGRPTAACKVSLQVGAARKEVSVIGDRVARFVPNATPVFTEPAPFLTMDLRYERAYGGIDVYSMSSTSFPYPRNPLGRGFAVNNTAKSVEKLALPNLEDPNAPLKPEQLCIEDYTKWKQQPPPTALGWYPKTWQYRARLAGIMPADRAVEQQLRKAYAELVPKEHREAYLANGLPDMDFRFFNGASSGLALPYLTGGETVIAENLTPQGLISFQLPVDCPKLGLDIGSGLEEPPAVMHTAMIRMEDRQMDLVWRGAVNYPGPDWLPQMRKMEVLVA